ncbi:MAG: class I SAM-dependent methyltransferase [Bacillota bacterium]
MAFLKTDEIMSYHSFEWHNHIDDLIFGPGRRELDLLRGFLSHYPVKSVLDVACGDGDIAIMLAGLGKRVTVLDQDYARLKSIHLKSILAGVQLEAICGDMRDLSSVYKSRCNLITSLRNSLPRLINDTDIWGTLAQMYLALESEGLIAIQMFDYDRLYKENIYDLNQIDSYYSEIGVKVYFEHGRGKSDAKFIFDISGQHFPEKKIEKIIFPVRPIFQNELDMWLAELGFKKIENFGKLTDNYHKGDAWQNFTIAFRPGSSDDH